MIFTAAAIIIGLLAWLGRVWKLSNSSITNHFYWLLTDYITWGRMVGRAVQFRFMYFIFISVMTLFSQTWQNPGEIFDSSGALGCVWIWPNTIQKLDLFCFELFRLWRVFISNNLGMVKFSVPFILIISLGWWL